MLCMCMYSYNCSQLSAVCTLTKAAVTALWLLPCQDKLSVSTGGVGLYTPDPRGEPQVFYLGQVLPPSSFYKPAVRVGPVQSLCDWLVLRLVVCGYWALLSRTG